MFFKTITHYNFMFIKSPSIMACPKCRGEVEKIDMFIVCKKCRLAYPILGDVLDMLIENAWHLEQAEKLGFKHNLTLPEK
jgi:uncharacterized protein YbaR (Trm112 family)